MATTKAPKQSEDSIGNILHIVQDKILKLLPIQVAATMSVLSKQWRCNWLSLKHLDFDDLFEDGCWVWQECCNIISSVLLQHNGPRHEFTLYILKVEDDKCVNLAQWLSFLSKNEVRCIKICSNGYDPIPISSHIFGGSEFIHLGLHKLSLHPLPSNFIGFPKLQHLRLTYVEFSQEDIFPTLMAKCHKLATLRLSHCRGMSHIVIEAPTLETLTILDGTEMESVAFREVSNLKSIEIWGELTTIKIIDSFNNLASSRQLQCIKFIGGFCKFLAGASIERPLPAVFNHLKKLSLKHLDLSYPGVLQNIVDMVGSCPYMKELYLCVCSGKLADHQKLDFTRTHKSDHLLQVEIEHIDGAAVEIQLIKYLLNIAVALERFLYKSYDCDIKSQLKLSTVLLGIPRASPKARLIFGGNVNFPDWRRK